MILLLKKGVYRYTDNRIMFGGVIEILVEEKPKNIKMELLKNTFRYNPMLIDSLFAKSNVYYLKTAQINGREYTKKHALRRGEAMSWEKEPTWFIIYPNCQGIPFLFEHIEAIEETERYLKGEAE